MPCDEIPSCNGSIGGSWRRRDWEKRASPPHGSWEFGSGLCCEIRFITTSSAAVARDGSHDGGVRAGMLVWVVVVSDRQTD